MVEQIELDTNQFKNGFYLNIKYHEVDSEYSPKWLFGVYKDWKIIQYVCFAFWSQIPRRKAIFRFFKKKDSGRGITGSQDIIVEFDVRLNNADNTYRIFFEFNCTKIKKESDNYFYYYWFLYDSLIKRLMPHLPNTSFIDNFSTSMDSLRMTTLNFGIHLLGLPTEKIDSYIDQAKKKITDIIGKMTLKDKETTVFNGDKYDFDTLIRQFVKNKEETLKFIILIERKYRECVSIKSSSDQASIVNCALFSTYNEFLCYNGLFNLISVGDERKDTILKMASNYVKFYTHCNIGENYFSEMMKSANILYEFAENKISLLKSM